MSLFYRGIVGENKLFMERTPTKLYCYHCEEMHELKEFLFIGNGIYGRSRICKKKGYLAKSKTRQKKLKEQREYFAQFSPI